MSDTKAPCDICGGTKTRSVDMGGLHPLVVPCPCTKRKPRRIVVIDSCHMCADCARVESKTGAGVYMGFACVNPAIEGRELKEDGARIPIPDWCPLAELEDQ